jgi:hypothetical protein
MDWQEAWRARLLAVAPLASLLEGEIHWGEAPQGTPYPNLAMLLVADGHEQHLKGFWSIQPARIQIDARGASYLQARAIKSAFLAAALPGGTTNGHTFSRAMVELPPRDIIERVSALEGQSKSIFRVSMDLTVHHAPTSEEVS